MRSGIVWLMASLFSGVAFAQDQWEASKDSTWKGQMGTTYKLNNECNLLMTADGNVWSPASEKMWQDKNNNYIKYENRTLMWSTDRGSWNSAEKWVDANGMWYKIDDGCHLLVIQKTAEEPAKESPYLREKKEYRMRMNKLIRRIDKEIASYRNRNGRVKRRNRPVVEQLEQQKADIRTKLREMGKKHEADWTDFKKSLDAMLNTSENNKLSLK